MNEYRIEFYLKSGEYIDHLVKNDLPMEVLDNNIADLLSKARFITAGQSETSVLSVRCDLVDKYRVSVIKD